ncbi:sigma factor-like helix-turn-helix DNA-binding protein [Actinoplanes sp. NPDC048967]|uniref:sigma factor-like helix-turn-helix DNA-binding protein n=1 Tax=Actinoplanes sp. NPDC048967 TaxID=3155269 RepID=UPI0033FBF04F
MAESVGLALMVVLDTLGPAERLAFVLHDVFAVPFDEIAEIVGTSGDAAKMLAWRARRKVRDTPRPAASHREQRAVVDAFMAATGHGDFEGLLRVLDPDVTWREHTARGLVVRSGSTEVAARVRRAGRARGTARRVRVNDAFGVAAWTPDGRLRTVMACTVVNGRIVEMESVTDPARLASLSLPRPTVEGPWTRGARSR